MVPLLSESIDLLRREARALVSLLSLLVPAAFLLGWGGEAWLAPALGADGAGQILAVLAKLAILLLYVMFMVASHRRFLLGSAAATLPSLGRREARFVTVSLIMAAVLLVPFVGLQVVMGVAGDSARGGVMILGIVVLVIASMVVNLRFGLALPAVAVDRPEGVFDLLRQAWEATRGALLSLFGAWILLMLGFVVPLVLAFLLFSALFGLTPSGAAGFLVSLLIEFASAAVTAALFSAAYRRYVIEA